MRVSNLGFGASSLGGVFHDIREAEGEDPAAVEKYQDPDGAPYKAMVERLRGDLGLTSLALFDLWGNLLLWGDLLRPLG